MKVYTRTGDDGTTGLLHGGRVDKDDLRTAAYGTTDEAVSVLGLARAELDGDLAARVLAVQRALFAVGAQLATHAEHWNRLDDGVSRVSQSMVEDLEAAIDELTARSPLPQEFVVPGQTRAGAALDVARTIVRRAERAVVALQRAGHLPDPAPLRWLNRCSDYLFVLARTADGEHLPSRPR